MRINSLSLHTYSETTKIPISSRTPLRMKSVKRHLRIPLRTTPERTLKIRHLIPVRIPRKRTPSTPLTQHRFKKHRNRRHAPRLPAHHHLRRLRLVSWRYRPETHLPPSHGEIRSRPDLADPHVPDRGVGRVPCPGGVRGRVPVAGLHDVDGAGARVVEGGAGAGDDGAGFRPVGGGVDDGAVRQDTILGG